jgi:hypothetical protein
MVGVPVCASSRIVTPGTAGQIGLRAVAIDQRRQRLSLPKPLIGRIVTAHVVALLTL